MSEVLEPKLDHESLRVLRAIPACGDKGYLTPREVDESATLWRIAERLDATDLANLQLTLNGLTHLHYAMTSMSRSRKRQVWWRTPKGDRAAKGGC